MKNLLFIWAVLLCITTSVWSQNDEKYINETLKEFYTAYNNAWNGGFEPTVLIKKLDSLKYIYCTRSLLIKLKEDFKFHGFDHDILIQDNYADTESLKTLTVVKDSLKVNDYIVSYIANTEDPRGKKIKKKITINVTVKKEEGSYKISNVSGAYVKDE